MSGSVVYSCVRNCHRTFAIPQNLCMLGTADANRCPHSSDNGCCIMFLEHYKWDDNAFLDQIVTGDETRISHNTPTSKRRSMEWHHAQSPKRPRKFKQSASAQKLMASVFWDRQGVLLVDFMPCNTTINADAYCATLRCLRQAIQNRRRGKLSYDIVLIHDNACPHTARQTQSLLHDAFHWDIWSSSLQSGPGTIRLLPLFEDEGAPCW